MRPKEFFAELPGKAEPERIAGVAHAYLFDVEGEGRWLVDVRDGKIAITENPDGKGDVQFSMSGHTFDRITARKQNPMVAYMTGKVKVTGDIRAAMDLQNIL